MMTFYGCEETVNHFALRHAEAVARFGAQSDVLVFSLPGKITLDTLRNNIRARAREPRPCRAARPRTSAPCGVLAA